MSQIIKKVDILCRHIEEVQRNCKLLGERLIENGEEDIGLKLIANGLIHDASKFKGIEWEYLFIDPENEEDEKNLSLAIEHHNHTNFHHPEAWGGIKNMPSVYVAELVCDWKTRSSEFGSSLVDWINDKGAKRFSYTKRDKVYKEIMHYTNILLEEPFK